jgi:hypothetical protein
MGKVLDGCFGVTEATAILFARKYKKKVKSVFPFTIERRNSGIEVLSVNATSTNGNSGRNKRRRRSELVVNSVSVLCDATFHLSE